MENISCNNFEIALIRHQLISCNAELIIKPLPNSSGGDLEISTTVEIPKVALLKKDQLFNIKIIIDITGNLPSGETAFKASCKFEGQYRVIDCEATGVSTKNNDKLWSSTASQLYPLAAKYLTDITSEMGFRNIKVLPLIPSKLEQKLPKNIVSGKRKNKKP